MKASLLAVALLATIAISSAVDEECVQRKLLGLPVHWPNPSDCLSFYRCTNKDVKRTLLCPAGKEYNPKTGRCANLGKNLCKLSLAAPLVGATNPCADKISGTFVPEEGKCRSFNICNDNIAYPQNCDVSSYFNTTNGVCEPDTAISCWENLCVSQENGAMVANSDDCLSFYVCNKKTALLQNCPAGSYFDKFELNCQPGDCPIDINLYCDSSKCINAADNTTFPAINTTTGYCECINQKPEFNKCVPDSIYMESVSVCVAQNIICPASNCFNKPDNTNFPAVGTNSGYCSCLNNEATYNQCADDSIFIESVAACVDLDKVCLSSKCLNKPDNTNFPAVNTTTGYCTCLNNEASYNQCTDDSIFMESVAACVALDKICPSSTCLNKPDNTNFPAVNTTTGYCTCLNNETTYNKCSDDSIFEASVGQCVVEEKVCPSSNCMNKPDFTNFPAVNSTTGYCTCINKKATYNECADDSIFEKSIGICVAQDKVCPSSNCLNIPDCTNFPAANTTTGYCRCENNEATYYECSDDSIFEASVGQCVVEDKVCPSINCLNKPDYTTFPAINTTTGFCLCLNNKTVYNECPDNSIFEESLGICMAQEKVCPSSNCLNIPNCTNFAASNTTTGYCRCENNEATYYECPNDSIFEVSLAVCVLQEKVCPSLNCLNKPDYATFPAANTTTGYCTCLNNEATYHDCAVSDYTYDTELGFCVKPPHDDCEKETPSPLACEGKYSEGDFVANVDNCMLFYICYKGELVESSCGTGNYYNDKDKACLPDTKGKCPDCTEAAQQATNGRNKRSVKVTCVDGDITAHPTDSDKFYICDNGNQVLTYYCDHSKCIYATDNNTFPAINTTTGYCVCINQKPEFHKCPADSIFMESVSVCVAQDIICPSCNCLNNPDNTYFPAVGTNIGYCSCVNNEAIYNKCFDNSIFDASVGQCVAEDKVCPSSNCLNKPEYATFPAANTTTGYCTCLNNEASYYQCEDDSIFEESIGICVAQDKVCPSSNCLNKPEYATFPAANTTTGYCTCLNNEASYYQCEDDSIFEESIGICVAQDKVCPSSNCLNIPNCTNFAASNTTTGYCRCENNEATFYECPNDSIFEVSLAICVAQDKVCPSINCLNKPDYATFPASNTTTGYCTCLNHEATYYQCEDDSIFVESIGICVAQDKVCPSSNCLNKPEYATFPAANTTTGYCTCLNNEASYYQCEDDSIFEESIGICVAQDKVCPSSNCLNKPEYATFPAANTTTGYCTCLNNEATYYQCEDGSIFMESVGICVAQDKVCPSSNCLNKPEYATFPAANTTTGYCTCLNNEASYYQCEDDSIFEESIGICVAQDKVCPSSNCLNKPEYATFPAANTTTGYCTCLNNEATYYQCEDGSIFMESVGICVAQDKVCPSSNCLNKPDYATFPAINTTTGFCRCLNNEAIYYECPDDSIFEESLGICMAQDEVCPSSNCLNIPNCTNFAASNTTSGYCRCENNEATYHDCAVSDYNYDREQGFCVKLPHDDCEEETPSPLVCEGKYREGDFVANTDNCMLFYICFEGELVERSCGTGNYYDDEGKVCLNDREGKCPDCTEAAQQVANGRSKRSAKATCVEGDITAHPTDCDKFYICNCDGEQVLQECGEGNYYNPGSESCEVDIYNKCSPKTDCSCPGGYSDGQMSSHPTDCDKFYVCVNGNQELLGCGTDNFFNKQTLTCEKDINNVCSTKTNCTCPGGYIAGQISPHPTDCDKFYICDNGNQVLTPCGVDNYFNKQTLTCEKDINNECYTKTNCTCPGGYIEGQLSPHPSECHMYYICSDSKQVLMDCGTNNYFKNDKCVLDTEFVCWPNECIRQSNGQFVPNSQQCNAYFMCQNQKPIAEVCPDGDWFDASKSSCQPDVNAVCYNPCAYNETIILMPNPDRTKYFFCNANQTIVGTCVNGYFDATLGICKSGVVENACSGQPNGYAYANPNDKETFYICLSGVPQLKSCPPNHQWNLEFEVCLAVSDPDCDGTPCLATGYVPPFSTINATEDNAFCLCRDGIALKNYCQYDMVFNADIGVCFSNAPCDPTACLDSQDYTVSPNRNDTQSFCLCVSETPVIVGCPNNESFNPFTLACSNVEISPQCNQYECIAQSNFYKFNSSVATDNGFCMCRDHIATYIACPEESTYDGYLCIQNNINCDSRQCVGLANNTKIPSITTTEGYCQCVDLVATFNECPLNGEYNTITEECMAPACDPNKCNTASQYLSFPATNTTTGFCICFGTIPEYRDCPAGQEFNTVFDVCLIPLEGCKDSLCDGLPEYSAVPAWNSTQGFCLCSDGTASYQNCPSNNIFSNDLGHCTLDIEGLCGDKTYCQTCLAAGTCNSYPANNNPNGFCLCYGASVPNYQQCSKGHAFDPNQLVCLETPESNCDYSLCADATVENPITSPALIGNTTFCYCAGPDDVMLLNCPNGKYYNNDVKLCINIIEESCSCPNGMLNGDIVADDTSCNKYLVCADGLMHEQTCAAGEYFNAATGRCCVDTSGVCKTQTPYTCLGAYHEGELIEHPVNAQMYYVCENSKLHERNCGLDRIFLKDANRCIKNPRVNNRFPQKRTVDNHNEFQCIENEKRSVPSNCSQYEICLSQLWKRRTCSNFRYYNPEEQKCLKPSDDYVCLYAKLTSLPTCNHASDLKLIQAKTCQQYYRCENEKWRLESCEKQQYFNSEIGACVALPVNDGNFQCEKKENETAIVENKTEDTCQHLTIRYYEGNCAMYFMCLDNNWWYQHCPVGMYFNRSLNYCIPDLDQLCQYAFKSIEITALEEFANETCPQDGSLRSSALACNRYFICIKAKWQMQHCNKEEFFDVANTKCSLDVKGVCLQLNMDCLPDEKRMVASNCTAFEQCSKDGKWLKRDCPLGKIYDDLMKDCIVNDGTCSRHGLKRVCKPRETKAVMQNCSMFYYCSDYTWQLGNCLKGFMYSPELKTCLPHTLENDCKPLILNVSTPLLVYTTTEADLCKGQLDGSLVAHPGDCTRFYICIQEKNSQEMQCSKGSYFESSVGYCRPNDGSCRLPLNGVCENATEKSLVAHPTDCQSYYKCSSINGTELMQCPAGQYFHNYMRQCRADHGECKKDMAHKCFGLEHGTRLAHELYCNIYYVCDKGLAIPVECPNNHQFNAILGKCLYDEAKQCENGQLIDGNSTYSCGNLANGSYIPDRQDCTRYYICTNGKALIKKCSSSTYFDSQLLLCIPDDGSCPFLDKDVEHNQPMPPDPKVCEGKHGYLIPDPFNCNNFYACVHNKLKHERCYSNTFFNTTLSQCQSKHSTESNTTETLPMETTKLQIQQCVDEIFTVDKLCSELAVGSSIAEQDDCRLYVTCQEAGEEPLSQRCRNGESYDSILGFCRQNDGTCLLENGQRVGECSGKHGQLVRDVNNCRGYFTCINGQKIAKTCEDDEYFSKSQSICLKDTLETCGPSQQPDLVAKQLCTGLSESIIYPYIYDNCRSYFQCFNGEPKIHKCADDLHFDPATIKCVKGKTECLMPTQSQQRSPELPQTFAKLCSNKEFNTPHVNLQNNCSSFYFCHRNGKISHELCPLGKKFDKEFNICMPESLVICN